jgi:predicted N-formylglutamate amidohydrolase
VTDLAAFRTPDVQGIPSAKLANKNAGSRVLLVCEHASSHIPARFDGLGLSAEHRLSHAVWDPGAVAVARHMSSRLDAGLVFSTVSRLVYDCNRPPGAPDAIPVKSEYIDIPGNVDLSEAEKNERVRSYYMPFCNLLTDTIAENPGKPVIVTIHSFTPVYMGRNRDVEVGIVHDADRRLADQMLKLAPQHTTMVVLRNSPYGPEDGVTHTLKAHGIRNRLLNLMLEIRSDLIATEGQQRKVAEMLSGLLRASLSALAVQPTNEKTKCPI